MGLSAEVLQYYYGVLAEQIAALGSLRDALNQGDPSAETSIRRGAHALRGSGGTYGFPQITAAAGLLEDAPREDVPSALDSLLNTLQSVLAEANAT